MTEEIVGLLRGAEVRLSQGQTIGVVCRGLGISEQSYYRWRREYRGLKLDQAKRFKDLERENERLKKAVSELMLDKLILKEALEGCEPACNFAPTREDLKMVLCGCVGRSEREMLTVETIGRVRHAFLVKGKGIKQIARELRLSRNTVRTIVRSGRACKVVGQPCSTQRRCLKTEEDETALTADIVRLAARYWRYGYRRIREVLVAEGWG